MGYGLEVDMVAEAHRLDLLTTPYVFNEEEAIAMTKAGADIVVAHMGVTTGGAIGATSAISLDDCVSEIDAIAAAARSVRKDVIVLCHGGRFRCRRMHGTSWIVAQAAMVLWREFNGTPACRGGDPQADGRVQGACHQYCGLKRARCGGGRGMAKEEYFLYPTDVESFGFDWGRLALTVAPEVNGAERFSGGVVDLPSGRGIRVTIIRARKRSFSSSRERASRWWRTRTAIR